MYYMQRNWTTRSPRVSTSVYQADSCPCKGRGAGDVLPKDRGFVHFGTELVIYIGKSFEKGMKVDELVDSMAVGIDFTLVKNGQLVQVGNIKDQIFDFRTVMILLQAISALEKVILFLPALPRVLGPFLMEIACF